MPPSDSSTHILVVDDDEKVRRMLRRLFEDEGYRVSEASCAAEARPLVAAGDVNLITLDLNLGGEDGLMLAREVRQQSRIPIVMITGKGDMIDKVVGLELGADDYISKPFHLREVLARIRSVLRRAVPETPAATPPSATAAAASAPTGERYVFNGWTLDMSTREFNAPDGASCELTSGEFDLLAIFVQRPNRVLSRDQIMDLMKGHDWNPNDRTIDNQIARLRKKIESDPKNPRIIKTIRGAGYSFTGTVART